MFDYTLGLRTGFDMSEVRRMICAILGLGDLEETNNRYPGLFISMEDPSHPIRQEVYSTFLGAPFTASLYYSMNSRDKDQLWRSERLMAVSAARLAVETDALAFMTFNLDSLIMRRTDGVLYLYESFGNTWKDPGVISQIPQPWIMTDDEYEGTPPGGSPHG